MVDVFVILNEVLLVIVRGRYGDIGNRELYGNVVAIAWVLYVDFSGVIMVVFQHIVVIV